MWKFEPPGGGGGHLSANKLRYVLLFLLLSLPCLLPKHINWLDFRSTAVHCLSHGVFLGLS